MQSLSGAYFGYVGFKIKLEIFMSKKIKVRVSYCKSTRHHATIKISRKKLDKLLSLNEAQLSEPKGLQAKALGLNKSKNLVDVSGIEWDVWDANGNVTEEYRL